MISEFPWYSAHSDQLWYWQQDGILSHGNFSISSPFVHSPWPIFPFIHDLWRVRIPSTFEHVPFWYSAQETEHKLNWDHADQNGHGNLSGQFRSSINDEFEGHKLKSTFAPPSLQPHDRVLLLLSCLDEPVKGSKHDSSQAVQLDQLVQPAQHGKPRHGLVVVPLWPSVGLTNRWAWNLFNRPRRQRPQLGSLALFSSFFFG